MSQYPKLTDPVSGKEAYVYLRMLCARHQSPIFIMIGDEEARPGNEGELDRRLDKDAFGFMDILRTKTPGDTMFYLVRRFLLMWMDDQFSGQPPEGENLEAFQRVVQFINDRLGYIPPK